MSEVKIQYETFFDIQRMCFDVCIKDFANKVLDLAEVACIKECSKSLEHQASQFKWTQSLKGFKDKNPNKFNMPFQW